MEINSKLKKRLTVVVTILIIIFGCLLRIWKINRIPISLFGDEIDVGLQAYSVLTTSRDYFGNFYPVMFHSFSEYRLPIQLYLDVPFIKLFGLNMLGVRFPSVLMGFLSILFCYLLVKHLFNRKLAIIASIFLLYSPWHFNFSRQANDAGIVLPFLLGGTLFFLKGLKDYKYLVISIILFGLSFYTYAIATLFTPLFCLTLILIYRKEVFKISFGKLHLLAIIGIIIISPYLLLSLRGISSQRFSYISVFQEDKLMGEVVARRRWSNSFLNRILYNKKTIALELVANNYIKSFSSDFLFSKGDPNMRQGIEGFGQMYHIDIILVFLGLWLIFYKLVKDREKEKYLLIFSWLILSPIPSSLTQDGGTHAARLILMLIPLIIVSAIGFDAILRGFKNSKNIFVIILICVMIFELTRFIHRYFIIWPNDSWRFWQFGYKETVTYVADNKDKYQRIVMDSTYEPMLPRFLFYTKYDMNTFQKQFRGDRFSENIILGLNGFSLGNKYYFGELQKPIENIVSPGILIVANGTTDVTNPNIFNNKSIKLLKEIKSPTNIPVFYIFTSNEARDN